MVVLLVVFLGMIFEEQTGIPSYYVAIIGAVVNVLLGIFTLPTGTVLIDNFPQIKRDGPFAIHPFLIYRLEKRGSIRYNSKRKRIAHHTVGPRGTAVWWEFFSVMVRQC